MISVCFVVIDFAQFLVLLFLEGVIGLMWAIGFLYIFPLTSGPEILTVHLLVCFGALKERGIYPFHRRWLS